MTGTRWLLLGAAAAVLVAIAVASKSETLSGARVKGRQRAAGVHPRLQAWLDWWELHGPFAISIGQDGGLRTDEVKQAGYFASGASKARTLAETPHGRAGALDAYPFTGGKVRGLDGDPDMPGALALFEEYGRLAEAFGLTWGGRWGWDRPHVELPDWKTLPYPPNRSVA